jgi:AcrR family transcriptional regulator
MIVSIPDHDAQPAGRPSGHEKRRSRTERLVLDATWALLCEGGCGNLTVEGVSARSGVAKTTIYRRYRSKNDLALAVLLESMGDLGTAPYLKKTATEFERLVSKTADAMSTPEVGRIMKGLVSEIAQDPEVAQVFRERLLNQRVEDVRLLTERGVGRGELRAGLDPEMVTDLLFGPLYYRLFLTGSPVDRNFTKRLVRVLMPALAPSLAL